MIQRTISSALNRLSSSFPAVLVTGARQTGKTTLLKNYIQDQNCKYLTFDSPDTLILSKNDPSLFMSLNPPPVIFDEIQYVPNLFRHIKIAIDSDRKSGMFYLTGSQQFNMMQGVSESLAGRIGILNLLPLSLREIKGDKFEEPFIPTQEFLVSRNSNSLKKITPPEIWSYIQKGMYPELYAGNITSQDFYSSYIKTYVERDVRQLTQVADEMLFMQFIAVVASRTGQLVNFSDIARTVGIDPKTARQWISILQTSGIVYLLQPYFGNIEKRLVKTPKLYFSDTGLAAHLTRWLTSETLMTGAMNGAFFETFVVNEIRKSFTNAGLEPPLYYYRDSDCVEIDLLIESNGTLYPVEIKATSSPKSDDAKNFYAASHIKDKKIARPVIICNSTEIGIAKDAITFPVQWI